MVVASTGRFHPWQVYGRQPAGFLALLAVTTLTSILFTWVFNNTNGSILAAMLMHASMN